MPCVANSWRALALAVLVLALGGSACGPGLPAGYEPREGDLVFQSLPLTTELVEVIEGVSESRWSHCGIVERQGDEWVVLEALQTVHRTPLADWIARGRDDALAVYRLAGDRDEQISGFLEAGRAFLGKPYDLRYAPDDDEIYCSELIQKAWLAVSGEQLGVSRRLGELNWEPYEAAIRRLDGGEPPLDRPIVTPRALTESPALQRAYFTGE